MCVFARIQYWYHLFYGVVLLHCQLIIDHMHPNELRGDTGGLLALSVFVLARYCYDTLRGSPFTVSPFRRMHEYQITRPRFIL